VLATSSSSTPRAKGPHGFVAAAVAVAAIAAVLLPAALDARGQGGREAASQAPVTLAFAAIGADGSPIRDLKPAEVSVRIGGRDRAVQRLDLVPRPSDPGGGATAIPPPFGSNAGGGGQTVMLAIEDESIPPGHERDVRTQAEAILSSLQPGDRAGLLVLPRPVVRVAPTTDIAQVRAALGKITGRRPLRSTVEDNNCRTRDSLETLRGAVESLASLDGSKLVVVMSGSLSAPARTAGVSVRRQTGDSNACEVTVGHYEGVGAAVAASGSLAYVMQVDDRLGRRDDGLEALVGAMSGGTVLRPETGDAVARMTAETAAPYVVAFSPEATDRGDQPQRLELRISRDGVTTRVPGQFLAAAPAGVRGNAAAAAPRDMVRSTDAFRALPMRTVAYAARQAGDKLRILVLAEPAEAATLKAAAAGLVDSAGKVQQVAIDGESLASLPLVTAFEAAPGRYRVRVAATDSGGRGGAADYEFVAQLVEAGALKLSDLVLGVMRNGAFAPALQFSGEQSAVAYFEAYGQLSGNVAARVEIAQSIDGPALATVQPGGQRTSEADKFLLTAELPIGTLAPGDYVVRAFLKVGDGPEGRLIRTLRK
jgi:hypothetical protein